MIVNRKQVPWDYESSYRWIAIRAKRSMSLAQAISIAGSGSSKHNIDPYATATCQELTIMSNTIPSRNLLPPTDLPDLSKLRPWSEWAAIVRAIVGGGSRDRTAYVLLTNSVRLLDAAIGDYQLGRSEVLNFHARDPQEFAIGYITRATTHFESCVWHLERFIKHARALRSLKGAEPELKALISKNLNFFAQDAEHSITRLRHTLSHLEKAALSGELSAGTSIALLPLEEGLQISTHVIGWQQLVDWLTEAHACVGLLANFRPTVNANKT
ncbi:MAG: hypothetical protein IBJ14_07455 [Hydrogenophaga sp.]|nr:hypothetical protein [Hydrogenophaga sp.]